MTYFSWHCPFCNHDATIREHDSSFQSHIIKEYTKIDGGREISERVRLATQAIVCPNIKCRQYTLKAHLFLEKEQAGQWKPEKVLNTWALIPRSEAKTFPDYIPKVILDDYNEACLVKDLSPKASATLSRRCLQGMIRDFWKIIRPTLKEEIDALKVEIEPQTWDAIKSVKDVGNIGAHMEKDINLIIDVEPNEAVLLIRLIEILLKDWYVAKQAREDGLKAVVSLAKSKKLQREQKGSHKNEQQT